MKPPDALFQNCSAAFEHQTKTPNFPEPDVPILTQHYILESSDGFDASHLLRTCPDLVHPDMPTLLPIDETMDYSYSDEDIPSLISTDDDDDGGGSYLDGRRTPPDFHQHLDAIRKADLSSTSKTRQISFSCLDEPLPNNIQSLLMELSNEDTQDLTLNLNSIIESSFGGTNELPDDLVRWSV